MKKVSLGKYRTKGVKVFSGFQRGSTVAHDIILEHGEDVEIIIPDDVITISRSFRMGFNVFLPGKLPIIVNE